MSEEPHPIDELKKLEPASLKVVLVGGEERAVPVPKVRNRWSRVHQVIDSLQWMRVEALDKGGGILGVVEAAEEPELDDIEGDDDDEQSRMVHRAVERLTKLCLDTGLRMQREMREMFAAQMRGTNELVQQVMQSQAVLVESYRESMAVQRAALAAEVSKGSDDNPAVNAMLQLAMHQVMKSGMPQLAPAAAAAAAAAKPQGGKP